jgi:hypothetical protein
MRVCQETDSKHFIKGINKMHKYIAPSFKATAYNCPLCAAYAKMNWYQMSSAVGGFGLYLSRCSHCGEECCWRALDWDDEEEAFRYSTMLIPDGSTAPMPHPEMPDVVKVDYVEARDIVNRSPRGAAALLRLAIQKLCIELGETTGSIDKDIKSLVAKGLPEGIQQALDVVRVVGNHAVHPGELTADDIAEVSISLFELINAIVEERIARPKALETLYLRLPEGARNAIAKRDGK